MKEYTFTELGYFTENIIDGIKKAMQGKTFMNFEITSSNYAGNCILIIKTDYEASESKIKEMFLSAALYELSKAYNS